MSRLADIDNKLRSTEGVLVEDWMVHTYLPGLYAHHCAEVVEICVAPLRGLYTIPELQAFMESLVDSLGASDGRSDFHAHSDGSIDLGHVLYREDVGVVVGQNSIMIAITVSDVKLPSNVTNGKVMSYLPQVETIIREVFVRVYPDTRRAKEEVLKNKNGEARGDFTAPIRLRSLR